jgi:hypothetical protein
VKFGALNIFANSSCKNACRDKLLRNQRMMAHRSDEMAAVCKNGDVFQGSMWRW